MNTLLFYSCIAEEEALPVYSCSTCVPTVLICMHLIVRETHSAVVVVISTTEIWDHCNPQVQPGTPSSIEWLCSHLHTWSSWQFLPWEPTVSELSHISSSCYFVSINQQRFLMWLWCAMENTKKKKCTSWSLTLESFQCSRRQKLIESAEK